MPLKNKNYVARPPRGSASTEARLRSQASRISYLILQAWSRGQHSYCRNRIYAYISNQSIRDVLHCSYGYRSNLTNFCFVFVLFYDTKIFVFVLQSAGLEQL